MEKQSRKVLIGCELKACHTNKSSRKEVSPFVRWLLRPMDRFVSWYWDRYFEDCYDDGSW